MIYIFIILAVLNGLLAVAVVVTLYYNEDEVDGISLGFTAFSIVNTWFFGVAAYLV